MPPVSRVTAREMAAALRRAGFRELPGRGKGSHLVLEHPITRAYATIPYHAGRTLGVGLTRKIIRDAGITIEEFRRLL